jgi:hypothetical protein
MDEISKLGDINSVNDLFDFKLSIKTILFLAFAWGAVCFVVIVFMLGGVNNTVDYVISLIESVKTTVLEARNKNINKGTDKPMKESPPNDKPPNDKKNNE